MAFEDKTLACKDCGKDFIWTAGEQKFYADKGFENSPTRCTDCRKQRKREKKTGQEFYPIVCKECGKAGQVPFQPRDPNSLLCADCFAASRNGEKPSAKPAEDSEDAKDTKDADKDADTEE